VRFVLIDRLLELEAGQRAVAVKTFAAEEDLFRDHFPGLPVVPGVLLTEAMGQTGGWLLAATLRFSRWPLLTRIDRASFRRLVRPGDEIRLEAVLRGSREQDYEVTADASVHDEPVARARFLFHAFDFDLAGEEARELETWTREVFHRIGGHLRLQDSDQRGR
jgi:3-hydroxyacyl-[acyl-carrier-protein] dehydratase